MSHQNRLRIGFRNEQRVLTFHIIIHGAVSWQKANYYVWVIFTSSQNNSIFLWNKSKTYWLSVIMGWATGRPAPSTPYVCVCLHVCVCVYLFWAPTRMSRWSSNDDGLQHPHVSSPLSSTGDITSSICQLAISSGGLPPGCLGDPPTMMGSNIHMCLHSAPLETSWVPWVPLVGHLISSSNNDIYPPDGHGP